METERAITVFHSKLNRLYRLSTCSTSIYQLTFCFIVDAQIFHITAAPTLLGFKFVTTTIKVSNMDLRFPLRSCTHLIRSNGSLFPFKSNFHITKHRHKVELSYHLTWNERDLKGRHQPSPLPSSSQLNNPPNLSFVKNHFFSRFGTGDLAFLHHFDSFSLC